MTSRFKPHRIRIIPPKSARPAVCASAEITGKEEGTLQWHRSACDQVIAVLREKCHLKMFIFEFLNLKQTTANRLLEHETHKTIVLIHFLTLTLIHV